MLQLIMVLQQLQELRRGDFLHRPAQRCCVQLLAEAHELNTQTIQLIQNFQQMAHSPHQPNRRPTRALRRTSLAARNEHLRPRPLCDPSVLSGGPASKSGDRGLFSLPDVSCFPTNQSTRP